MSYTTRTIKKTGESVLSCSEWKLPKVFPPNSQEYKIERAKLVAAGHIQICPPKKAALFGRISRG